MEVDPELHALYRRKLSVLLNLVFTLGMLDLAEEDTSQGMTEGLVYATAPRFQAHLVQGAPDPEALRETLWEELHPFPEEEMDAKDALLYGTFPEGASLAVLDARGRVLASLPEKWAERPVRRTLRHASGARVSPSRARRARRRGRPEAPGLPYGGRACVRRRAGQG